MTALTRQQVLDEVCRPMANMLNSVMAGIQNSPAAEKAWRRCIAEGRKPVYHAGYVGMQLLDVEPPEGWHEHRL